MPRESFSYKKIAIIGLIVLVIAGIVGYVFINRSRQLQETGVFSTRNLFPFSDQNSQLINPNTTSTVDSDNQIASLGNSVINFPPSERLRKITNYPVTGFTSFITEQTIQEPKLDEKTGETVFIPKKISTVFLRFNSKINGIIADAEITNDSIIIEQKTTSEIPVSEEVWFTDQGKNVFYRSWNENNREITTLFGRLITNSLTTNDQETLEEFLEPQPLASLSFLPEDILRGDVSPNSSKIFFLKTSQNGVVGVLGNSEGLELKTIFNSPFTEWRPQWINDSLLSMTTLASREADGYMYELTPNAVFKKILGPIRGLTTITNPLNTLTLLSTSTDQGLLTRLFNHISGSFTAVSLTTLPEKCVWQDASIIICAVPVGIPRGIYPDQWYQGIISFNDQFWSINTSNQVTELLFTSSEPTDAVQLDISPDKKYLFYVNKINGTLWSYRMSE